MSKNYLVKLCILGIILFGLGSTQSAYSLGLGSMMATPAPTKIVNKIFVTTTADLIDPTDGLCSLREAVIAANINPDLVIIPIEGECKKGSDTVTDQIALKSGETYFLTIVGGDEDGSQTGDLDVVDNSPEYDLEIIVEGNKENRPTIDGAALNDRIFEIGEGANVLFDHIKLENSVTAGRGGGIYNNGGFVHLESSGVAKMKGTNGGGIYNQGEMSLSNSDVVQNVATGSGGGIFNNVDGTLYLSSTNVLSNEAGSSGGGIANIGGIVSFIETVDAPYTYLASNEAESFGGGIGNFNGGFISGARIVVSGNEALGQISDGSGGGIFNSFGSEIELAQSSILNNEAKLAGSGIYNEGVGGKVSLEDSTIYGHELKSAVENRGLITLVDTEVQSNTGGAIVSTGGELILVRSQVYDNISPFGGGIKISGGTDAKLSQSSIYSNSAAIGGSIYVSQSSLEMSNTTVSGNLTTLGIGGGIHFHGGFAGEKARFYNVTIADNSSKVDKGNALSFVANNLDFEVTNTILTMSQDGGSESATACFGGTVDSKGSNIVFDETCLATPMDSDQIVAQSQLDDLSEIDGTMGHLPKETGLAFGTGNVEACAAGPVFNLDQRGLTRQYGCDIGAIERYQAPPPKPTATPGSSETPAATVTIALTKTEKTPTPVMSATPVATSSLEPSKTPSVTLTPQPGRHLNLGVAAAGQAA